MLDTELEIKIIRDNIGKLSEEISSLRLKFRDVEYWLTNFEDRFNKVQKFAQDKVVENRDLFLEEINHITNCMGKVNESQKTFFEKWAEFEEFEKTYPSLEQEKMKLLDLLLDAANAIKSMTMVQEEQERPALLRLNDKIREQYFPDFGG